MKTDMTFSREKAIWVFAFATVIAAGALAAALYAIFGWGAVQASRLLPPSLRCESETPLQSAFAAAGRRTNRQNDDGTIRYFYDDFDAYAGNSLSLEEFDVLNQLSIEGAENHAEVREHVNGGGSLSLTLSGEARPATVTRRFASLLNLGAWNERGEFTLWLRAPDGETVREVSLRLIDAEGDSRRFEPLASPDLGMPNFYDKDDPFPDIPLRTRLSASDEWTDFRIEEGWNFLFWHNDSGYWTDEGDFNEREIAAAEITIVGAESSEGKEVLLDDLRLVSGLQADDNPLAAHWYEPHGRPQYGVFEVDTERGDSTVKLVNVRQSQYPSNGDHARMITKGATPENFAMRVRFGIEDLGKGETLDNTWVRIAYDFDPAYDPGHDWFGFYSSFEWEQTGLVTVIPVQRFALQDEEPSNDLDPVPASTRFALDDGEIYELELVVRGQKATARLYEAGDGCLTFKREIEYEFSRPRYGPEKRYPISIEATGEVKLRLYEVEIAELES